MSKIFYDHLLELKEIDQQIKKIAKTKEEREELWGLVDEIIHHKVMGCIFDNLPRDNHEEFLQVFHKVPYDDTLVFEYLKKKAGTNIEEVLKDEISNLTLELLQDFK